MSKKAAKPRQTPPKHGLYTPEPVQNRVISRHIQGESNRKIAREEGVDRETVSRILSQKELKIMMAQQRSRMLRMGDKALAVYEEALDCKDLRIAVATASKVLESIPEAHKSLDLYLDSQPRDYSGLRALDAAEKALENESPEAGAENEESTGKPPRKPASRDSRHGGSSADTSPKNRR